MFNNGRLPLLFALSLFLVLLLAACGGTSVTPTIEPAAEPDTTQDEAAEEQSQDNDEDEAFEAGGTSAAGMRTFIIAPNESQASYIVDEEFFEQALSKYGIEVGRKDTVGTTPEVTGQIQLNLDDLSAILGENAFTVDLSMLASDQNRRDNWIRENGPTFDRFPMAAFTATAVSGLPESYELGQEIHFQVTGDLTVHEVTVPVTFDAVASVDGDTLSGTLETRQLISDFGIEPPVFAGTLKVTDEFGIRVEFTAREE